MSGGVVFCLGAEVECSGRRICGLRCEMEAVLVANTGKTWWRNWEIGVGSFSSLGSYALVVVVGGGSCWRGIRWSMFTSGEKRLDQKIKQQSTGGFCSCFLGGSSRLFFPSSGACALVVFVVGGWKGFGLASSSTLGAYTCRRHWRL